MNTHDRMLILSLFLVPKAKMGSKSSCFGWAPSSRVPLISLLEVEVSIRGVINFIDVGAHYGSCFAM